MSQWIKQNKPITITFFFPKLSEMAPKNKQPTANENENILPAHAAVTS